MKKFLIFLAVVFVLIAGGIFALVQMAPVEMIREKAVAAVKEQTGRDLSFADARLMLWPNVGVRLNDVTFSNPGWAAEKNMVTLAELDLRLALRPLMNRQIDVVRFVMRDPVINLETAADGRTSWTFDAPKKPAPATQGGESSASGMPQGMDFKLGDFEIKNGTLSFNDRKGGQTHRVENVNIVVTFPDMESELQFDGTLNYRGKRVTALFSLDRPVAFSRGETSKGNLLLKTEDVNAGIRGDFMSSGALLKNGFIEADIASLPQLVAWASGAPVQDLPFQKISFKSAAAATGDSLTLTGAELALDEVQAKGDVSLAFGGAVPDLTAQLSLNRLDLDRFLGDAAASGASGTAAPAGKTQEDWDATPIDFSGLRQLNADLVLDTQGFSLRGVDVGASKLTAKLRNGKLAASSSPATLFGGTFSSDVSVDAATAAPALGLRFKMAGVQAEPVLSTFADFKKLSGAADANIDVTAVGNSQKAIIGSLQGSGAVTFKNGALTGIDLVNIAQLIQKGLGDMGVGAGKTEFVDLGGTFTILNGVVNNKDLRMRGPLVQASGAGNIDLPKKSVNYRVTPVLTASSAVEGAGGVGVPVDIKGPFNNIRVKPDFKSMVTQAIQNPDAIKGTVKNVKEQGKALEDNLRQLKKDPNKALENLMGGGGIFGRPAASPQAAPDATPEAAAEPAPAPAEAPAAEE